MRFYLFLYHLKGCELQDGTKFVLYPKKYTKNSKSESKTYFHQISAFYDSSVFEIFYFEVDNIFGSVAS